METETMMEPTTETRRMSSGEALAEILATVTRIEAKLEAFGELAETVVDQIQEVAASGLGSMLGGLVRSGDSEHPQDSG